MSEILKGAAMVTTILRVRDVAASVAWYREKLGLEPVHVGSDGPDHPVVAYTIAGAVVSMWQLPSGKQRDPDESDRNTYVCLIFAGELESRHRELLARGVDVGKIRRSENNEFFWFNDPDGNRFELSRPLSA